MPSEAAVRELMLYTDKVAEVQNTLRASTSVAPSDFKAVTSTDNF